MKLFFKDLILYPVFLFVIWVNLSFIIFVIIGIMFWAIIHPHRVFAMIDEQKEIINILETI